MTLFKLEFPTGLKNPTDGPYSYLQPKIEFKNTEGVLMSKIALPGTFVDIPCAEECKSCSGTLDTCKLSKPEELVEEISSYLLPVLLTVIGLIVISIVIGGVLWYMKCLKDS